MAQLNTPQPARCADPTARAVELTHLIFERPDLDRAEDFLLDFGLLVLERTEHTLYMRGTGPSPYCYRVHRAGRSRFVGCGLAVRSTQELARLSRIEGASAVTANPHFDGGQRVVLEDPSGFVVEATHGRARVDELATREPLVLNVGASRARINVRQSSPLEPPAVIRLGHLALDVADFQKTSAWYTQHLGFIPSDVQVLPDGSPAVVFLRLDLGDTPADHHTIAIAQGLKPEYNHSAFEVVDADAVGVGQRVLRDRGYTHAWGIGRHLLGSQIFDYWADTWGEKHEHYCDGDMFTSDVPMGIHDANREGMAQWGQPMPSAFARPALSVSGLMESLRHVRCSPDLSMRKVLTMARLFL